jgi:hypothetical protein
MFASLGLLQNLSANWSPYSQTNANPIVGVLSENCPKRQPETWNL